MDKFSQPSSGFTTKIHKYTHTNVTKVTKKT